MLLMTGVISLFPPLSETAAVYSGEYTSGRGSSTHPLPWCVIASRLMGKKAGEHSRLKAEIESLKEQ